jgi:AmiR/NasT family two-component response regulator
MIEPQVRFAMVPVIALARSEATKTAAVGIAGYLVKPYWPEALKPAIELALAQFAAYCARDTELHELKRDLETHKLLERARDVVMTRQHVSAEEATRRLEHLATTTQRPLHVVAEALLLAEEVRQ